jgi:hypothetical protein
MPLDPATEKRIRDEAAKRGADPGMALAEAERIRAKAAPVEKSDEKPETETTTHPVADRLLIGFLPFMKVRELRSIWLGLPERVQDDEMFCGDFAAKHGGAASAPAPDGAPE